MHPLMFVGLLPDSRQVSRDAAERHAILTARKGGEDTRRRPPMRRWRLVPQS